MPVRLHRLRPSPAAASRRSWRLLAGGRLAEALAEGAGGRAAARRRPRSTPSPAARSATQGIIRGPAGDVRGVGHPAAGRGPHPAHRARWCKGRIAQGRRRRRRRWTRPAAPPCRATTPPPTCCNAALREVRRARPSSRPAPGRPGPPALRLHPVRGRSRPSSWTPSSAGSTSGSSPTRPVNTYEMALKDVPGSGIIAVFDEKYGDTVRVVDIDGVQPRTVRRHPRRRAPATSASSASSSESSIAAGVRRIEALCGPAGLRAAPRREHASWCPARPAVQRHARRASRRASTPCSSRTRSSRRNSRTRPLNSARWTRCEALAAKAPRVGGVPVLAEAVGELRPWTSCGA